jgi:murein L,D-transpeptidase YafK
MKTLTRVSVALGVLGTIAMAGLLVWANRPGTPLPRDAKIDRLVVEKGAGHLLAYSQGQMLKVYPVSIGLMSGPKVREGDLRTPEGSYSIDWHNPASKFHRALHVSYPSPADLKRAQQSGHSPGGSIMIHGLPNGFGWVGRAHLLHNWTAGCIAVTNPEIDELYRAVPNGTSIEIRP